MWPIVKRLSLGLALICAAAAVLLMSDLGQRKGSAKRGAPALATLKYSSRPLLDMTEQGILDALADAGFVDRKTVRIDRFNAENDMANANVIAKEITSGRFDMVLTISTPCLQAVANANKAGKAVHVFGAVTDPFGAGVGISRKDHLDHPRHLVGIGTFQPVKKTFRLAKQMYPGLKSVGVVWNPAEACSEACTLLAREICQELGIQLLEAPVDNSAGVLEAAESLVGRGVDALWVGGDNTVEMAIRSLLRAGAKGRVPVFNNSPQLVEDGVLFGLGAEYYEVGRTAGDLAAKILSGADPATIPVEDCVPELLAINQQAIQTLKAPWRFTREMLASASVVIDEDGKKRESEKANTRRAAASPKARWKVAVVRWVDRPASEESEQGIMAGLQDERVLDRVEIKHFSAQGDIATLNSIMDSFKGRDLDLLFVVSTPTLQAALQRFKTLPVIFTCVANPLIAGAGETSENHRPNCAGISTISAFDDMAKVLRECMPQARKVGTLFVPSEDNSVYYKEAMVQAMQKAGLDVAAVGVNSNSEVSEGALALCARGIDAVCQISDNMTAACFPAIELAAIRSKTPVFSFRSSQARAGAVVAVARDYVQAGRDAGRIGAKVLQGASPGSFPFRPVSGYTLVVNLKAAKALGLQIPESLLSRADEVIR